MRRTAIVLLIAVLTVSTGNVYAEDTKGSEVNAEGVTLDIITSVPRTMSYQGILKDGDGNPVANQSKNIIFRIYDDPSAGELEWEATIGITTDDNGMFTAELDDLTIPFDEDYWLELEVDAEILSPRQKLTMVGYAARADAFTLPYSGSVSSSGNAFSIANTGEGKGGRFTAAGSAGRAVEGIALSEGDGMNRGGFFEARGAQGCGVRGLATNAGYATNCGGYFTASGTHGRGVYGYASGAYGIGIYGDATAGGYAGHFNGKVNIGGVSTGYDLPTVDGAEGQVLATDGSGQLGWIEAGGVSNWSVTDSVLYTNNYWGIARGGADNVLYGDSAHTLVNLGVASTTGAIGSTVGGGSDNTASASYSTVSGGWSNIAIGGQSVIGGGGGNTTSGTGSIVSGGINNSASGTFATVGGGNANTSSERGTVGGGVANTASYYYATVGGGSENTASGSESTIGGGGYNIASGQSSTVGGGHSNTASSNRATVGGGSYNKARGQYSIVSGGGGASAADSNSASGNYSAIGGGRRNIASGSESTIGGGYGNTASGVSSTVGGGWENKARADRSTVGGGYKNLVDGMCSVIPGGYADTLTSSAQYSMAFGRGIYITGAYRVAFFNSDYSGRLGLNRDANDTGILYPIHVGTNNGNGNGAHLTNGGVWTNGSSRIFKENFQPLNGQQLLATISSMQVDSWNFKDSDEKHIGPVAEDFAAAFDVGTIRESDGQRENKYLAAGDVAGVALAGVKELINIIEELKLQNTELETRIAALEAEIK